MNSYEYISPDLPPELLQDIEQLVAQGAESLIDIGCYEGYHSMQLRWYGLDITALDIRDRDIDPPIRFIKGDARHIDQYGVYDIALCHNLIYHLDNPVDFLLRLRKVVRVLLLGTIVINKSTATQGIYSGIWMPQEDEDFFGNGTTPTFMFDEVGLDKAMEDTGWKLKKEYYRRAPENSSQTWLVRRYELY